MKFEELTERLKSFGQYQEVMRRSHDFSLLKGLYDTASECKSGDAIEVGTFGGVSAAVIASAIDSGTVFTVDIDQKMAEVAKELWNYLDLSNIQSYISDSFDFLKSFNASGNVKFGLIDGLHSCKKCITEYNYLKKIIGKGIIIIDDYGYEHVESKGDGGVPKALDEIGNYRVINECYAKVEIDKLD